jgi:hypothetical protein
MPETVKLSRMILGGRRTDTVSGFSGPRAQNLLDLVSNTDTHAAVTRENRVSATRRHAAGLYQKSTDRRGGTPPVPRIFSWDHYAPGAQNFFLGVRTITPVLDCRNVAELNDNSYGIRTVSH